MRTMVLTIDRAAVLAEVGALAAYVGAKRTTAESDEHDRVRTVKEDAPFLAARYAEAFATLECALHPWYRQTTPTGDVLLDVPLNMDMSVRVEMRELMRTYLADSVLADWLGVLGMADDAKVYAEGAATTLEGIRKALAARKRPLEPIYDEAHDVVARRLGPER